MAKIYKVIFLAIVTITFNFSVTAQDLTKPSFIPGSPEVASLTRYGIIPVDHSTGVPNIEIPLFTIESGDIKVPISISYHASGIKVRDIAPPVGLGWAVNAGGLVTGNVIGKNDDQSFKDLRSKAEIDAMIQNATTEALKIDAIERLDNLRLNTFDRASDRYVYRFMGRSGVIREDFISGGLHTLPFAAIKTEKKKKDPDDIIPYFEITDEKGTRYTFDIVENSISMGGGPTSRTWHLSEIVSSDGVSRIQFYYSNENSLTENIYSHSLQEGDYIYWEVVNEGTDNEYFAERRNYILDFHNTPTQVIHSAKRLDSIATENVSVHFNYIRDRNDFNISRLTSVVIKDKHTSLSEKKYSFKHSYFGNQQDNLRLRLDELWHEDTQNKRIGKHRFVYNSLALPPYYKTGPNGEPVTSFYEDYWGYYNGHHSSSLIPSVYLPSDLQQFGGNRNPNPSYVQACLIKEIHYPTGGKSVFDFEPNKGGVYDYVNNNNSVWGAVRIKSIKNYSSETELASHKTYEYHDARFRYFSKELFYYEQSHHYVYRPPNTLEVLNKATTWRKAVSEPFYAMVVGNNNPMVYGAVTETIVDGVGNKGKTYFSYRIPTTQNYESLPFEDPRYIDPYQFDYGIFQPLLESKVEYRPFGSGFKKVHQLYNSIVRYREMQVPTGVRVDQEKIYIATGHSDQNQFLTPSQYLMESKYSDTYAHVYVDLIDKTTERWYDSDETEEFVKTTDFLYGNTSHVFPTQMEFTDSKGQNIRTAYKYPGDYSNSPYPSMVAQNIIQPVIEEIQYNGEQLTKTVKTDYALWNGTSYLPKELSIKYSDSSNGKKLLFAKYDTKNNPEEVVSDFEKNSYLWSYNGQFPVAKAKNALNNEIAYTGFESDGKGNWSYSGGTIADGTSPTGNRAYDLSGGNLQKSGLSSSKTYLLSYWAKSTAAAGISGGTAEVVRSHSGWTMYRRQLTGVTSVTLSGSVRIDEVRLHPINAHMTTYTYDPLIGMTSQTDARNYTTYYEYDSFGRLMTIKDEEGNIMETYEYNYITGE